MAIVFRCERCFKLSEAEDGKPRLGGRHTGQVSLVLVEDDDYDAIRKSLTVELCAACESNFDTWLGKRPRQPSNKNAPLGIDARLSDAERDTSSAVPIYGAPPVRGDK